MTGSQANLEAVWNKATKWERDDGIAYYGRCRSRILDIGDTFEFRGVAELCGMFAALSPNNDEAGNFRDLIKVLESWRDKASGPPIVSSYPANSEKAWQIANGRPADVILGGKKVIAFWHNLLDPTDRFHVTIDGHMVSCWHGSRLMLRRRADNRESAVITSREYDQIADDVRALAKRKHVLPSQLQSTLWLAWKRLNRIRYSPQLKLFSATM